MEFIFILFCIEHAFMYRRIRRNGGRARAQHEFCASGYSSVGRDYDYYVVRDTLTGLLNLIVTR